MSGVKIFLDDFRNPADCIIYMSARMNGYATIYGQDDWVVVKNYPEFVEAIKAAGSNIGMISFDHDLAEGHYHLNMVDGILDYDGESFTSDDYNKTGYHCAKWLLEYYQENNWSIPEILVHSMNPAGTENIKSLFKNLEK